MSLDDSQAVQEQPNIDQIGKRLADLSNESRKDFREAYRILPDYIKRALSKDTRYAWLSRAVQSAC